MNIKFLIIIILFTQLICSCKNNNTHRSINKPPKEFSGIWIRDFIDGNRTEFKIKNGIKKGKAITYNKSNQVIKIAKHENDKLNGKTVWYHANREIIEISNYKNGKFHGKLTKWHNKREGVISELTIYKNGKRLKSTKWFENGRVKSDGIYKNDFPFHGTFTIWGIDSKNNLIKESFHTFKNGKQILKKGEYTLMPGK